MRRRLLQMWLGLALRAMERAAGYSAELLKDKTLDDLALSYKILYRAATGQPAPAFRPGGWPPPHAGGGRQGVQRHP